MSGIFSWMKVPASGQGRLYNPKGEKQMATIEDFRKIELIVAQIKEVKEHPNADRLYVIKVDTGKEERQVVAGIRRAGRCKRRICWSLNSGRCNDSAPALLRS